MDREAWQAIVHGVIKLDTTEGLTLLLLLLYKKKVCVTLGALRDARSAPCEPERRVSLFCRWES